MPRATETCRVPKKHAACQRGGQGLSWELGGLIPNNPQQDIVLLTLITTIKNMKL